MNNNKRFLRFMHLAGVKNRLYSLYLTELYIKAAKKSTICKCDTFVVFDTNKIENNNDLKTIAFEFLNNI